MRLALQPVRVATSLDEEGVLVFDNAERLVAVLTHLGNGYGDDSGRWYLEAGFGRVDSFNHPTFPDLDTAKDWISRRFEERQ